MSEAVQLRRSKRSKPKKLDKDEISPEEVVLEKKRKKRRVKGEQKLELKLKLKPRPVVAPLSELGKLVLEAYGGIRKEGAERKKGENRKLWAANQEKLERDLQSHKSFWHLHSASRRLLLRDDERANDPLTFNPDSEGAGPLAGSTVYTQKKQSSKGRKGSLTLSLRNSVPSADELAFKAEAQKVRVRTLSWLEAIPPVVSWTAIPFNVAEEDGKFLTNIPFLGDEVIDKDRKFIDDMLNLYQGNIHDLKKHQKLDEISLSQLVKTLQSQTTKLIEESELFSAISEALPENGSPTEIRDRYKNLEEKRSHGQALKGPPQEILASGILDQDPSKYSIPNIDGPHAKDLPREKSMHAFACLFCRRCYQYDCPRGHNGDDQIDNSERNPPPISGLNFTCENPTCWRKTDDKLASSSSSLTEWSPSDASMFRCLIKSFPDPCYVASLMLNKDCTEVKRFAEQEPSQENPQISTPTTAPPPSASNGKKRTKKSSSSVSKKNLSRRWINSVKRTENTMDHGGQGHQGGIKLPARFMPCAHAQGTECDEKNEDCYCAKNGTSCEKFCGCPPSCKIRFPGCRCVSTCDSRRCVCFVAARECDPDLCTGCGASEADANKINCRNVNIQRRLHKHLLMGRSDVAGWGIFIKEDVQKGEFIAEYRGEIISHDESERRGHVYDKLQHTFLFELNDHFVVDATRKGNKSRFVNSSQAPNCEVKRMLVNGDHRIGIYAKRWIDAGDELFYDYSDGICKNYLMEASFKKKLDGVFSLNMRSNYMLDMYAHQVMTFQYLTKFTEFFS